MEAIEFVASVKMSVELCIGIIKIVSSYISACIVSVTQLRSRRFNIQSFPAWKFLYIAPTNGLHGSVGHCAANQTTGQNPFFAFEQVHYVQSERRTDNC